MRHGETAQQLTTPNRSVQFEMYGCLPLVKECCKDTAVQQEGYGPFMLKSGEMP